MSDDDIEETRRVAREEAAAHVEISDKGRQSTSIKNALAIIGTLIGMTVAVCGYLNRITNSQERIEATLAYKVPEGQLVGFANALEKMNRGVQNKDGTTGISVPDPVAYRPQPPR